MGFPLIKVFILCLLVPLIAGCAAYPRQYHYSGHSVYPTYPSAYYHSRQPYFPRYPYGNHLIIERGSYLNPRSHNHRIYTKHPYLHRLRKHDGDNHHDHGKNRPDRRHRSHSDNRPDRYGNGRNEDRLRKHQSSRPNQRYGQKKTHQPKMPATHIKRTPGTGGNTFRNRR